MPNYPSVDALRAHYRRNNKLVDFSEKSYPNGETLGTVNAIVNGKTVEVARYLVLGNGTVSVTETWRS